jgi:hypothetical protein
MPKLESRSVRSHEGISGADGVDDHQQPCEYEAHDGNSADSDHHDQARIRLAISSAMMSAPISRFSLVSMRSNALRGLRCLGTDWTSGFLLTRERFVDV